MGKFRKIPVEVEAMKFVPGTEVTRIFAWLNDNGVVYHLHPNGIVIETLEGSMLTTAGDWVIKGIKGEFYPCKPWIFDATYEPVE